MRCLIIGVVCIIVGFIFGILMTLYMTNRRNMEGKLRIDASDPNEPPYLFLELKHDPNEVMNKNKVYLEVDSRPILSREKQPR